MQDREFRRIVFGQSLDPKRLQTVLKAVLKMTTDQPTDYAAPVRPESVFVKRGQTTVYVSGNRAGLDAVSAALRSKYEGCFVGPASKIEARRAPLSQE